MFIVSDLLLFYRYCRGVAPFAGAETGTGGRLRDVQATGRGANALGGIPIFPTACLFVGKSSLWYIRFIQFLFFFHKVYAVTAWALWTFPTTHCLGKPPELTTPTRTPTLALPSTTQNLSRVQKRKALTSQLRRTFPLGSILWLLLGAYSLKHPTEPLTTVTIQVTIVLSSPRQPPQLVLNLLPLPQQRATR